MVTTIGTVTFHLLHLYAGIGQVALLADEHGHSHDHNHDHGSHLDFYSSVADHNSGSAWQLVIFLALMVIPPVVGLVHENKATAITMAISGLIYSVDMSLDVFSHGFGEGAWSTLPLTIVTIPLPAIIATIKTIG